MDLLIRDSVRDDIIQFLAGFSKQILAEAVCFPQRNSKPIDLRMLHQIMNRIPNLLFLSSCLQAMDLEGFKEVNRKFSCCLKFGK